MRFEVSTSQKQEMVDITDRVNDAVRESKIEEGLCNVFTLHTTAGIVINENWDPNIGGDFFKAMNKTVPKRNNYEHDSVDGNAQSHILSSMVGPQETIPVRNSELVLGKWQAVMLAEFDGPRTRKVEVTVVESSTRS